MRRISLVAFLAVAVVVAGCGSTTSTSGGGNGGNGPSSGGGGNGGGNNAHATVTFRSQSYNLSAGVCENAGVLGWEVKIGDYENQTNDFLDVIVSSSKISSAAGRVGGVYWTLATGKQHGTIGSDLNGSFDGTDTISGEQVTGTFGCS